MTISTPGLRPLPLPATETKTGVTTAGTTEPEVLSRERAVLRQIQSLVAERGELEAKAHGTRTSGDQTADSEYAKARQGLAEKLEKLEREARAADEKRRRSIIDAAIAGESKAKADFAAGSRKIATMFDSAREVAKSEYAAGKTEAATIHDSAQKKAAKQNA